MFKSPKTQNLPKNPPWEKIQEQLTQLKTENQRIKSQLEAITEGGGIKIIFPDKAIAKQIIRLVKPRILKELPRYSLDSANSSNLVLEGDNLHALASLYQYRNKVDLILTDPPYNTGKDFRYNDKQNELPNDEDLGDLIKEDDPAKHTKWMKFMLPRLILMKEMLKPSGVLAICIDERELFNLGKMLDEVFGEENRIAIINWQKTYSPKSQTKHVSTATEYVLVYARNLENAATSKLKHQTQALKKYRNPDNDPRGEWMDVPLHAPSTSRRNIYAIQNPFTGGLFYPSTARCWGIKKSEIKSLLEEWGSSYEEKDIKDGYSKALIFKGVKDFSIEDPIIREATKKTWERYQKGLKGEQQWPQLFFLKEGKGTPRRKRYLKETAGQTATTFWRENFNWGYEVSGHSQAGKWELEAICGAEEERFIGVKPLKLFSKIIQLWCPSSGLVLDPFAGTGTTGHAVLELNKETQTNRQFILIEQGNPKNNDTFAKTLLYPRLKAVITGKWADEKKHESLLGNFKYLKLTKQIDSTTILEMEREELIDATLSTQLDNVPLPNNTYLIAKNEKNEGIYLIWNGERESKITEKVYRQCSLESKKFELTSIYHIYARTLVYSVKAINFQKIPDNLLLDFGIAPEEGLKKTKWRK